MEHLTNPPKEGLKSVSLYLIGGSEIHLIERWLGGQGGTPPQQLQTMNNQFSKAIIFVTTALTPLVVVVSIAVGQAANANDYDQRGTYSYRNGADNTHCSIGYGCK